MPEDTDQRPVHVVVDCTSGQVTHTPLTDDEWEEHKRAMAEHADRVQSEQQERQRLANLVAGHPDPLVQELAKRLGLG